MHFDDIILFSPSVKGLQNLVNVCCGHCASHGITLNKAKTVCMHVFSNKVKWTRFSMCQARCRKNLLCNIYLGHIICNDLSDNDFLKNCFHCTVRQIPYSEGSLSVLRRSDFCFFKCIVELFIVVVFGVAIRKELMPNSE